MEILFPYMETMVWLHQFLSLELTDLSSDIGTATINFDFQRPKDSFWWVLLRSVNFKLQKYYPECNLPIMCKIHKTGLYK